MQQHPPLDTHDESYFASFTDMLVGIIFIFIILLMIVANNYQEATQSVTQTNQALVDARNQARDEARDAARDKAHDEAQNQEIAQITALAEAKSIEAATALEEVKALEAAQAVQAHASGGSPENTQAPAIQGGIPGLKSIPGIKGIPGIQAVTNAKLAAAKANDQAVMRRMIDIQQNRFDDSRAKILRKIQETMTAQGFSVAADINQGILLIPETILFDPTAKQGGVNAKGAQTVQVLANLLSTYLPCISPTADASRLSGCAGLNFRPNTGLDVIFIDDYPDINASREDKLLLSVERTVSLFNELKGDEPYLDKGLRNIAGVPILDIKVNQERRKAWNRQQDNPAFNKFVVLRFIMRRATQADIAGLSNPGAGLTR